MAVIFRCAFDKKEDFDNFHKLVHEALCGSPAYVNDEIVLGSNEYTEENGQKYTSTLIVGQNSGNHDIVININDCDVYGVVDSEAVEETAEPESKEESDGNNT